MSEPNRSRDIMICASGKEATYGGGIAVDSLIKADLSATVNPDPTIINNQDQLGAGREPDDQELLAMAYRMTLPQTRCKYHTLALHAAFGLGGVASALADSGTPAVGTYKHTFTVLDADALPTTQVEEKYKTGVQKLYIGAGLLDFGLSVNRGTNRIVNLRSNWFLHGNATTGSGSVTEKAEASINGGSSKVYLGTEGFSGTTDEVVDTATSDLSGTPADISNLVRSLEWLPNNNVNIEDLFRLGSGLYTGAFERGDFSQGLRLNFDYADETELTRMLSQTDLDFQFKQRGPLAESGYYYGMNLIFPKLRYAGLQRANDNGKIVWQATLQPLEHATYGSVILDVFNEVAAYAAA